MSSGVKYLSIGGLALLIGTPLITLVLVTLKGTTNGEILAKILVALFASFPLMAVGAVLLMIAAVKRRNRR